MREFSVGFSIPPVAHKDRFHMHEKQQVPLSSYALVGLEHHLIEPSGINM